MEMRRCYGCMKLTSDAVCPLCGYPADGNNEPHQLPVGTVLAGKYELGQVQSQEENGIIYLALDQTQDKTVLIREYFPGEVLRREGNTPVAVDSHGETRFSVGREMFCREAELLTREEKLRTVSGARELIRENDTAYLVMDLVRGPSLSRYVRMRGGKITVQEALRLLGPVLEAMAAFHQGGFAHGKISMETIVLDPMGGARLSAFGETPGAEGAQDVFALSRVFCGCLVEEGHMKTVRLEDVPGLTEQQRDALQMGLSPDPQQRFASAVALSRALLTRNEPGPKPVSTLGATEIITDFKVDQRFREAQERSGSPVAVQEEIQEERIGVSYQQPPVSYQQPPVSQQPPVITPQPPVKKKKTGLIVAVILIVLVLLLGGAAAAGYFLYHSWSPATCHSPRTCSICGKTEGSTLDHSWTKGSCTEDSFCELCGEVKASAPGHEWVEPDYAPEAMCAVAKTCTRCGEVMGENREHDWTPANCYDPQVCKTCGMTYGTALGHKWEEATYDKPRTCARCGQTEGTVKGYTANVSGDWEKFHWGNSNTYAYVFDSSIKGCTSLTLNYTPTFNYDTYVAEWKFLYRDTSGNWVTYQNFKLDGDTTSVTFSFSPKVNVSAVAVIPAVAGSYSYSFSLSITDVYARG